MSFKATYFDGESSASHLVNIRVNANTWSIRFGEEQSNFDNFKQINWEVNLIQKSDVYTDDLVVFTYGESFPFQRIESSDRAFIDYVNSKEEFSNQLDVSLQKSKGKSFLILISAILVCSSLLYFYVIPNIAVNFAKNLRKESVVSFGDQVYNNLVSTLTVEKDQSEKLQDFVNSLKIDSDFPITAQVVTDSELNAFAISGGKIIIYSALLEKIETEHQLAALIGHEISHIENRHMLKSISRSISGALFVSIVFGDVNSVTSILGENAHLFSQLSFSRDLEKEADIFGLEVLKNNNLDLHGMPELFQILKEGNSEYTPKYLSSHPVLDERIKYSRKIADKENHMLTNKLLKEKWNILKNSLH